MPPTSSHKQCVAKVRNGARKGQQCAQPALQGATCCRHHLKAPKARERAAVRAEVMNWGLGDADIDPGETLLRLVSQSARRAAHYARLLEQAYDAADRLKAAHEAHHLVADTRIEYGEEADEDGEGGTPADSPAVQTAKADLDRIFTLGGPAALIGHKYSASNAGAVYATGEAIRGLVELEAAERERCANWSAKAIAAGLAERVVRLAERDAQMAEKALMAALGESGLDDMQQTAIARSMARHLVLLETG